MSNELNVGDGYRRLELGEMIAESDEFLDSSYVWKKVPGNCTAFEINRHHFPHRRRKAATPAAGDGYRLLNANEIVEEGDEAFATSLSQWRKCGQSIGTPAGKWISSSYPAFRRKVVVVGDSAAVALGRFVASATALGLMERIVAHGEGK